MSSITKGKTWVDNEKVNYTDLNGNFDTVYNLVNGNLDGTNLSASAAIATTQIAGTAVTLANAQTFTGKKTLGATVQTITAATDGATVTFDLSLGNIHTVTMAGNRTLALASVVTGQCFVIELIQDATGGRTVTWFSTIRWPYSVVPTLTTTANKKDVFAFICTGSNTYDAFIVGQSL